MLYRYFKGDIFEYKRSGYLDLDGKKYVVLQRGNNTYVVDEDYFYSSCSEDEVEEYGQKDRFELYTIDIQMIRDKWYNLRVFCFVGVCCLILFLIGLFFIYNIKQL